MSEKEIYTVHKQSGILLNANESSQNLSETILNEISQAIYSISFNRYPEDSCQKLCEAYASWIQKDPSNILAGNGSDQHLGFLIGMYGNQDKPVLTLSKDFGMYDYYASSYRVPIVKLDTEWDGSFEIEQLIQKAKEIQPGLILFSNPNNPTGYMVSNAEIEKLAQNVDCPIVIDEAYGEFAKESALDLVDRYQHLFVTRTLSKAYALAGARVGFLIGNSSVMEKLRMYRVPYSLNSISMEVATIVIQHAKEFQDGIEQVKKDRDLLLQKKYHKVRLVPSQANFVLIYCEAIEDLLQAFQKKNLCIRDYKGRNYCRVTIGNNGETALVQEVLDAFEEE